MKRFRFLPLLLALCLVLTACGEKTPPAEGQPADDSRQTQPDDASSMFTQRDLRTAYDESAAAFVTLTGSGAACDSDAVRVQGSTVTILDEGTYVLTGELTSSEERQNSFTKMMRIALDVAVAMENK